MGSLLYIGITGRWDRLLFEVVFHTYHISAVDLWMGSDSHYIDYRPIHGSRIAQLRTDVNSKYILLDLYISV